MAIEDQTSVFLAWRGKLVYRASHARVIVDPPVSEPPTSLPTIARVFGSSMVFGLEAGEGRQPTRTRLLR